MTESAKATPPSQENSYPPVPPYPPGPFNGSPYPPGPPGAYPPFFPYPPPPDGAHTEGAQNGGPPAPYMMYAPPPGVMYAYPPHAQAQSFGAPPPNPGSQALSRPKRKQVKMACTNCAGACKRCNESRPCDRCIKYGIVDTCVDGQRKERKKGIKRGPYRRKNKDGDSYSGDWPPGSQPPASTAAAAVHAQYPPPEGYYPVYYPPGTFMHPHEGQSGPDGSPPHANGQPPMMPYYIHPGGYPPFPHYPPIYPPQGVATSSGAPLQPPQPAQGQAEQPQTINPADAARKPDDPSPPTVVHNGTGATATVNKKRSKSTRNGEPKTKKVKVAAAARPEMVKEDENPAPAHSKAPANDESDPESPV